MHRNRALPKHLRTRVDAASPDDASDDVEHGPAEGVVEPSVELEQSEMQSNVCSSTLTVGDSQRVEEDDMASERDRMIGQRVHALIAAFLRADRVPEPREVWVAAARVFDASPLPQNAACKQRAACATSAYFGIFHRADWSFTGAEADLGSGRVDLVWMTPDGLVVIDEVKMAGFANQVDDRATVDQVDRYRAAAAELFGDRFAGVRLLPLAAPGRALWCPPAGPRVPLDREAVA